MTLSVGSASSARIVGIGTALGERVLTNEDLAEMVDTSDEWIIERTGIRQRNIGGTTAGLAARAGSAAMEVAGVDPSSIDMLILATTTPDRCVPASSSRVQEALGLDCGAMDVNAACSGFVYSLVAGHGMIAMGHERVLVIGAEVLPPKLVEHRGQCMLLNTWTKQQVRAVHAAPPVVHRGGSQPAFHCGKGGEELDPQVRLLGQVAQNPGHLQVEIILEADDLPHGVGVAEQLARRRLGEEDAKRLVESSRGVARNQGQGKNLQNLRVGEEKGILVETLLPVADERHWVVHVQHPHYSFHLGRLALKAGAEDSRRRHASSFLALGDDSVDALAVFVKAVGLQLAENPDGHEHTAREPNR